MGCSQMVLKQLEQQLTQTLNRICFLIRALQAKQSQKQVLTPHLNSSQKCPNIKTVVNKIDKITHQFRFYEMEVLAGQQNFQTEIVRDFSFTLDFIFQNQGGIRMQLDLSKVYWCSKLQSERDRLLKMIKKNEIICDMFCGIGPFAIRAAKKLNCKVLANDLNPKCFEYLNKNIKKNKVTNNIYGFNLDARAFIRQLASKASINRVLDSLSNNQDQKYQNQLNQLQQSKEAFTIPKQFLHFDHVYMNLPADALEFLDVFDGIFTDSDPDIWNQNNLPIIHIYGFSTRPTRQEAKKEFIERINKAMKQINAIKTDDVIDFHRIKNISSMSTMYSISFRLPKQVAFHLKQQQIPHHGLSPKIQKKKIIQF